MIGQAFHILKKDVRHLRYQVALLVALSSAYGWLASRGGFEPIIYGNVATLGLLIVAMIVLGQAMHAEAIPGDRQFWITRPYKWESLLASKIFFAVLFINLPVLLGRALIVILQGIPLLPALPTLLRTQLCLFLLVGLPTAALASLTTGIVSFIFVGGAVFFLMTGMLSGMAAENQWPLALHWIRDSIALTACTAVCGLILMNQYNGRRTRASRLYGVAAMLAVLSIYRFAPLGFALEVQSRLSARPVEASTVAVRVTPRMWLRTDAGHAGEPMLHFDADVTGLPAGVDVHLDGILVNLHSPGGRSWSSGPIALDVLSVEQIPDHTAVPMDPSFFQSEHDRPLAMSASTYVTLFGDAVEKTLPVQQVRERATPFPFRLADFSNVAGDLQCEAVNALYMRSEAAFIRCRAVDTLSSRLVYIKSIGKIRALRAWLSYAPFRIDASPHPVREWSTSVVPVKSGEVTIVVKRPIAHVRRDFQLANIRLDDLLGLSK